MITRQCASGFDETMSALIAAIVKRGLTVFARIDHAAGARDVGMELDEEEVVLFGSPRAGTPLMQDDRRIGIELPLRILVWRDAGQVMIGYRDPRELADKYIVREHTATLEQMAGLLEALSTEASS